MNPEKDANNKTHKHKRCRVFELFRFTNMHFNEKTKQPTRINLRRLPAYVPIAKLVGPKLETADQKVLAAFQHNLIRIMKQKLRIPASCLPAYFVIVPLTRKARLSFRSRHNSAVTMDRKSRLACIRERRFKLRAKLGIETKE